ncbi:MAG TPA: hypothetical protein VFE29_01895 [Terriglobia bacterium]|nr:hypothetical protein [Terriglobia bacterium]
MRCPNEFTCALFAEGELPEGKSREIALHAESCEACDRLITALRGESRMLVQCLQDIDLEEAVEVPDFTPKASRSISFATFAFVIIGIALVFRISTGILFGFDLPAELRWLNPREATMSLGVAVNAAFYAVQNANSVFTDTAQSIALMCLAGALLFGMATAFKRSAATGSVIAVLITMGLMSTPSYAVDLRKGPAASIPASETVDDSVFATAGGKMQSIDIAGTVKGDVFAIGDVVTVSGNVDGNLVVIARRVEISGMVGGTVLGAAQTVTVSGRVGRNLITASGTVDINKQAEIGSNSITASSETTVNGSVQRDLFSAGGILDIRGTVGRDVAFAGGQLLLNGSSQVGGNLNARVSKEEHVRVASGATIGGQRNIRLPEPAQRSSRYLTVRFYVWQAIRVLTLFVTGLCLFKLVPALVPMRFVSGMDWLKAGGVGFMTLVAVPVAAIIVGITVIGLPIALVSFVLYLVACYFAKIIVAAFVGRSVMHNSGAVSLLAGIVLVVIAVNLPWIGGLINFVLILLGLGAIALTTYNSIFQRRATVEV